MNAIRNSLMKSRYIVCTYIYVFLYVLPLYRCKNVSKHFLVVISTKICVVGKHFLRCIIKIPYFVWEWFYVKQKTLYIMKKSCTLFFRTWITYARSEIPQVKSEIVLSIWNASVNEHWIKFCKIILADEIHILCLESNKKICVYDSIFGIDIFIKSKVER